MEYKRFTEEQKEKARNADIINFLGSYMGFEFKQAGKYYQCKQHNSLVVYPNRKGFVWNSRNISGGDCIDINTAVYSLIFRKQEVFRQTLYPISSGQNRYIRIQEEIVCL